MARKSDRQLITELLSEHQPKVRAAFIAAIEDIKSKVLLRELIDHIRRGDINGAIQAMQIEPEAYSQMIAVLGQAYDAGGIAVVNNMPTVMGPDGARVVFRFGVRNLEGERWLNEHSSDLVTRVVDDQRNAIRQQLTYGLEAGQNPRTTALQIIGKVNRVTGRREGGIVGLTSAQERYVTNARQELLSGDPESLRNYLTRERRDKRFDRTIAMHIRNETKPSSTLVDRATERYSDRLLQLRGETIARTETMGVLSRVRDDAIRQQIASGKLSAEDVTKIWHSASDERVRHSHTRLNLQQVKLDEKFLTPTGIWIAYPGDPDAPAYETINCRCWMEYKVDYFASVVRRHNQRIAA